jgi:hypothetical protein
MPTPIISPKGRALLAQMADGRVLVGALGGLPLRPNKRIFRMDDGTQVDRGIVVPLLTRGYLRVIKVDGPRNLMTVTELGREVLQHGTVRRDRRCVSLSW